MALAIARWRGEEDDGHHRFDVEIGANRFYAWAVGSGNHRRNGIRMLTSRSYTSPLMGPLEPGARGRTVLRVPGDAFTSDDHHLQLLSFRDEELRGPAASDLVEVPWRWTPPSQRHGGAMPNAASVPSAPGSATAAPAPMSHAQFLDALAGVVSQVLPFVRDAIPTIKKFAPVIGQLLGGGTGTAPASGGAAAPSPAGAGAAPPKQPDLAQLLTALLAEVEKATAPQPAPAKASSVALSGPHRYSYASWVQLLAALPALMPLLEKVVTPETVQAVVGAADPTKMLNTIINGVTEAAKIGQQATDKLHEHLRALNPGLGDDVLVPLLAAMSASGSRNDRRPKHIISRQVRLALADLAPVELGGYPQVAFRHGDEITLPVTVETPRPIPRPTLLVCVKDATTLRWLAERSWSFDRLEAGRLPEPAALPPALTHRLRPGGEYLVDLTLTWRGRDGLVGATTSQLVRIVGNLVYDGLDTGGPPARLDDVDRDRAWWHRVWAVDIDERSSRVSADLVYSYRFLPGPGDSNRRTETTVDLQQESRRRSAGRLEAGLDVAAAELSRLARRLTGKAFDEDVMSALADPAFARAFDRAAHSTVSLHGRRGTQAAVWVWPEVKLHNALFQAPSETSPLTGQVLSFDAVAVEVPVPALAHVVTTRSA